MNTIKEKQQPGRATWAILPGPEWGLNKPKSLASRGYPPDPWLTFNPDDPRVGRVVSYGGGCRRARIRAVVFIDGKEDSLLLEDLAGGRWTRVYPWWRRGDISVDPRRPFKKSAPTKLMASTGSGVS